MKRDKIINLHSDVLYGKDKLVPILTKNSDPDYNIEIGELVVITTKDNAGIYALNHDGTDLDEYKPFSSITKYVDEKMTVLTRSAIPTISRYFSINVDQTISDPTTMITEGFNYNGTEMKEFFSKIRRCLIESNTTHNDLTEGNVGKANIKFLSDTNSNNYVSGGTADIENKDVMVYFPEFYYLIVTDATNPNKFEIRISNKNMNGYQYSPAFLLGAYKACGTSSDATTYSGETTSDVIYSRHGKYRITNISQEDFKLKAEARGTGFQLIDYEMHKIIANLFYFKYKNSNSQAICGTGPEIFSGRTNGDTTAIGMVETTSASSTLVNFLGIEGAWGYVGEWIDGAVAIGDGTNDIITISVPGKYKKDNGTRTIETNDKDNYISKMKFGTYMDIMPYEVGGTSSSGFCDYGNFAPTNTNSRCLSRSYYSSDPSCGVAYSDALSVASSSHEAIGSRLAFRGKIYDIDNNIDLN